MRAARYGRIRLATIATVTRNRLAAPRAIPSVDETPNNSARSNPAHRDGGEHELQGRSRSRHDLVGERHEPGAELRRFRRTPRDFALNHVQIVRGLGGGHARSQPRQGDVVEVVQRPEVPKRVTKQAVCGDSQDSLAVCAVTVVLEAVVLVDGTVGDVTVTRSLDTETGLDAEAVMARKQWRWRPGTKNGEPVPVAVAVEMTFTLK
jgi:TonB family protein